MELAEGIGLGDGAVESGEDRVEIGDRTIALLLLLLMLLLLLLDDGTRGPADSTLWLTDGINGLSGVVGPLPIVAGPLPIGRSELAAGRVVLPISEDAFAVSVVCITEVII
jgi:hypothetical protein